MRSSDHTSIIKPPEDEVLPRFSSADYKPADVEQLERNNDMRTDNNDDVDDEGKPKLKLVANIVLEEGDLCYFPRGFVHQVSKFNSMAAKKGIDTIESIRLLL